MNELMINNVVVTKNEAIEMMEKAVAKVDKKGYRPGHRVEDIYGWFWSFVEKKVNGVVSYGDITKLENMIDADKLIFNC